MNPLIFFFFLLSSFVAQSQNNFGGVYAFGKSSEKPGGILYLYPTEDSTYLFYLELGRGAPSYNSGAMVGKLIIRGDSTAKYQRLDDTTQCTLSFHFSRKSVDITSTNATNTCGFGFGVTANGIYTRTSSEIPAYFYNRIGEKTYFSELNVDNWSE